MGSEGETALGGALSFCDCLNVVAPLREWPLRTLGGCLLHGLGARTAWPSCQKLLPGGLPSRESAQRGAKVPLVVPGSFLGVMSLGSLPCQWGLRILWLQKMGGALKGAAPLWTPALPFIARSKRSGYEGERLSEPGDLCRIYVCST